jgi:hypothetical protein
MATQREINLSYLFKDLTDVGMPAKRPMDISLLPDDQVYKWDPDRYRFYQELIQQVSIPNNKVVDNVLGIENRSRRTRELLNENIDSVANGLDFLSTRATVKAKPVGVGAEAATKEIDEAEAADATATNVKDLIDSVNVGLLRKRVGYRIKEGDRTKKGAAPPLGGSMGGGALTYEEIKDRLTTTRTTMKEAKKAIREFNNDNLISPRHEEVKFMDRIIFIATTFTIRAIALFIVEWSLNTRMTSDFKDAFGWYIGVYLALLLLWLILVNVPDSNMFFKMLFYYVYTGNSDTFKVYMRIGVHVLIQVLLIPVLFIVKDKENASIQDLDEGGEIYAKRRKIYKTLSYFTFSTWVLTSVIALRL